MKTLRETLKKKKILTQDSDSLDDLSEESTDSEDKQDEEDVEIDYSDDGEETSIWKKFKKKALKDNSDDQNIVKDIVLIYLVHVDATSTVYHLSATNAVK